MKSLKQSLISDDLDAVERGRRNTAASSRAYGSAHSATHNGGAVHTSRERPLSPNSADDRDAEEQQVLQRKIRQPLWTLDRGTGYHQQERVKHKKASLLETGRWVRGGCCAQMSVVPYPHNQPSQQTLNPRT